MGCGMLCVSSSGSRSTWRAIAASVRGAHSLLYLVMFPPGCLIITSGALWWSSRCDSRASSRVLIQQALERFGRIVMEPIALLSWAFALRQALTVGLIVHQSNLTDAFQKSLLTFGDEQNLIGSQRA